jgi:hypothetical protein
MLLEVSIVALEVQAGTAAVADAAPRQQTTAAVSSAITARLNLKPSPATTAPSREPVVRHYHRGERPVNAPQIDAFIFLDGPELVRLHASVPASEGLEAWAVRVRGGALHVLLINESERPARVDLKLAARGPSSIQRLLAPAVAARSDGRVEAGSGATATA